tara:strand:+ start:238 stop:438 length:201 start_codon:yes stop_codon:yes gene_type:complete
MTLTPNVEESLREAQGCLRNALAYASRNEKSYVCKHIASMLANIDNIIDSTKFLELLEDDIREHDN